MQSIVNLLSNHKVATPDILSSIIINSVRYHQENIVFHKERSIFNALQRLEGIVDFCCDTYGADYLLVTRQSIFTQEAEVVAELTAQGMFKALVRHNVITSIKANLVHENDFFEMDLAQNSYTHTLGVNRRGVIGGYAYITFANSEKALTTMPIEELEAVYSLSYHQKYGNAFPLSSIKDFYIQAIIRRALNNNLALIMDIGEKAEIFVRKLINVHDVYFKEFAQLQEQEQQSKEIKRSAYISCEPSKTQALLTDNESSITASNIIKCDFNTKTNISDVW